MSRPNGRMNDVADWMAIYGGTPAECARAIGAPYEAVKAAWRNIKKKMGGQAR